MNKEKKTSAFAQGKTCPLHLEEEFIPCNPEELKPIITHLKNNLQLSETLTFPKGTIINGHRLDLCKQKIGPEGTKMITKALVNNNYITSLMLGADGILDEGALAVSELVKQNEIIDTVYLGCNKITEEGAGLLSEALSNNKAVKGLWLKRNPIGDEGLEKLVEMLKKNNVLEILDLVNTDITLTGLRKLVRVLLEDNQSVNKLFLGGNNIDEHGAFELNHLLTKKQLTGLFLNVNKIGDNGAVFLSLKLKGNTTIQELGLASNGIGDQGVKRVCEALEKHPSIKYLDLGYSPSTKVLGAKPNLIGEEGVEAICRLIKNNNSITSLNLRKTGISEAGVQKIIEASESNCNLIDLKVDGIRNQELMDRLKVCLNENKHKTGSKVFTHEKYEAIRSVYRTENKS